MRRYIKRYIGIAIIITIFLSTQALAANNKNQVDSLSKWYKTANEIQKTEQSVKQLTLQTKKQILEEQKQLENEKEKLKNAILADKKQLNRLKSNFKGLCNKEAILRQKLAAHEQEIKNIQATVCVFAKDAKELASQSLITPELKDRLKPLKNLFITNRFPAPSDIKALVNFFFTEMRKSSTIDFYNGKIIDTSGSITNAKILRVGEFSAYYKKGSNVGFLRLSSVNNNFAAVTGSIPWLTRYRIKKYMQGDSNVLPMDVSHGAVFLWLSHQQDFMSWLKSGGVLVWPIIFIGVIAIIIIIERIIFFIKLKQPKPPEILNIIKLISTGNIDKCKEILTQKQDIPIYRVILSIVSIKTKDKTIIEDIIEEAVLKELPQLEKFLSTLAVLAAIAPLLGLLGTVSGMINTFQVITLFGNSNPRLMSGGISEALITTELGLSVAIPIILIHHFFERKVDKIIEYIEESAMEAANAFLNIKEENDR